MKLQGFDLVLMDQLTALIESGRIPHAMVIDGGSAAERHLLVRRMAQAVLCTADEKPCGQCEACVKIEADNHPDVITVGPEAGRKTISVDVIRRMREDAFIIPNESDHKVYTIEQAELLPDYAQNALLKILEEPPVYATFILALESRAALLPTVRSRTAMFRVSSSGVKDTDDEVTEAALRKAAELAQAAAAHSEVKILAASSAFEKDYDLLQPVLEQFQLILRDALILNSGGRTSVSGAEDAAVLLGRAYSNEQLLEMTRAAGDIASAVRLHANKNLTLARLCSLTASASE